MILENYRFVNEKQSNHRDLLLLLLCFVIRFVVVFRVLESSLIESASGAQDGKLRRYVVAFQVDSSFFFTSE